MLTFGVTLPHNQDSVFVYSGDSSATYTPGSGFAEEHQQVFENILNASGADGFFISDGNECFFHDEGTHLQQYPFQMPAELKVRDGGRSRGGGAGGRGRGGDGRDGADGDDGDGGGHSGSPPRRPRAGPKPPPGAAPDRPTPRRCSDADGAGWDGADDGSCPVTLAAAVPPACESPPASPTAKDAVARTGEGAFAA